MAMTAKVKDELSRLEVSKPCCRKAEVASTLRFAGGLHIVGGRIVVEAELDTANAARRLRRDITTLYGHNSEVLVMAAGGLRKGSRYVVRVVQDGEALARQTGLIDTRGRPVRGLPPKVVSAAACDAEAAWRGAFLAHGSLTEPGRSSQASTASWAPSRVSIAPMASPSRSTTRSTPRTSRALAEIPSRRAAPTSARAASGPGQVTSRAEERPGSVSEPWARKAPRHAATASQPAPDTTCGGRPRTGRPRVSRRPVWRASASPSLTTRTT